MNSVTNLLNAFKFTPRALSIRRVNSGSRPCIVGCHGCDVNGPVKSAISCCCLRRKGRLKGRTVVAFIQRLQITPNNLRLWQSQLQVAGYMGLTVERHVDYLAWPFAEAADGLILNILYKQYFECGVSSSGTASTYR